MDAEHAQRFSDPNEGFMNLPESGGHHAAGAGLMSVSRSLHNMVARGWRRWRRRRGRAGSPTQRR